MFYLTLNGEILSKCPDLNICLENYDLALERQDKSFSLIPPYLKKNLPTMNYDVIDDEGRSYINL